MAVWLVHLVNIIRLVMHLCLPRYLKFGRNLISQCEHSNWDTWKKIAQSLSLFFSKQKILKFFFTNE